VPIPAEHPILTDGVVTLRAPRPDDVQGQTERQREDPDRGFDEDDARRWIGYGIADAWAKRERLVFIVEYQGRYAGSASLEPDLNGNARVHYGLSAWARSAGVASRAVRLLLEFGFTTCGFHVIHWWARVGNWPSRRVAWATGFHLGETIPELAEEHGRRVDAWTGWIGPKDPRKPRRAVVRAPGPGDAAAAATHLAYGRDPTHHNCSHQPGDRSLPAVRPAAVHR
jgi:RimJ/RimL family protein N-acetyltransferase